jgi:hypothetical protein
MAVKPRNNKVTNAKNKGREFAKKIRAMFIETFGLDEEEARCAVGYEQGCDVKFLSAAQEKIGLYIEAKNQKQISLGPWLNQTLANTPKGGVPALVYHKPVQGNKRVWITVPIEHYLELRKKILDLE